MCFPLRSLKKPPPPVAPGRQAFLEDNVNAPAWTKNLSYDLLPAGIRKGHFIPGTRQHMGTPRLNELFMVSKRNMSWTVFHVQWKRDWHAVGSPQPSALCLPYSSQGCWMWRQLLYPAQPSPAHDLGVVLTSWKSCCSPPKFVCLFCKRPL